MNALIAACGRGRRPDLALAVLNEIKYKFGVSPDRRSYRSAMIACNQAEHLFQRSQTAVNGEHDEDYDSSVQWWECALALLRRMREENLRPDVKTYSSAISACEAAGEWQRALGVLQMILDDEDDQIDSDSSSLNLYCFNAAISACEKGGAWIEALELYERMLDRGGLIKPNFITLSSLIEALDKAGQKELAQSMYEEGRKLKIVQPWRWTQDQTGKPVYAMVCHMKHEYSLSLTRCRSPQVFNLTGSPYVLGSYGKGSDAQYHGVIPKQKAVERPFEGRLSNCNWEGSE
jgi:pentatricopeptide repeat protein